MGKKQDGCQVCQAERYLSPIKDNSIYYQNPEQNIQKDGSNLSRKGIILGVDMMIGTAFRAEGPQNSCFQVMIGMVCDNFSLHNIIRQKTFSILHVVIHPEFRSTESCWHCNNQQEGQGHGYYNPPGKMKKENISCQENRNNFNKSNDELTGNELPLEQVEI